jgi:hypothetical protein
VDAAAGKDAIIAAGEAYLPKLSDQTQNEFSAYIGRAAYFNATGRTIDGLKGMLFRQPPTVTVPDNVKPMLDNVTLSGVPLQILTLEVAEEVLTVGRVGILVDFPQVDTSAMTLADTRRQNLQPLMTTYVAESILNWQTATINNVKVLSQVRLEEDVEVPTDEFTVVSKKQYRVLDLARLENPLSGETQIVYRVRVFEVIQKDGKEEDVQIGDDVFPKMNGDYLDYIPFYFISVDDVSECIDEPPLLDLVDMNLAHFRTTADYEHGCHFTGLPTPVVSGYTPDATGAASTFGIGSMSAWVFPRPEAKAYYLEFTGQGLGALKENITAKEQKMAVLGARMLEGQGKSGVESADTAGIHRSGEQSTLASAAQAMSIGISLALNTYCMFAGASDPKGAKFDLNRDFFPPVTDALTLTALIAGWQNGAYGYETLFNMLKQNEIIALEQTVEGEIASMKLNPPVIPGGTQVNQSGKTPIETPANPTIRQMQTPPK